jgi:hypothetical protein
MTGLSRAEESRHFADFLSLSMSIDVSASSRFPMQDQGSLGLALPLEFCVQRATNGAQSIPIQPLLSFEVDV